MSLLMRIVMAQMDDMCAPTRLNRAVWLPSDAPGHLRRPPERFWESSLLRKGLRHRAEGANEIRFRTIPHDLNGCEDPRPGGQLCSKPRIGIQTALPAASPTLGTLCPHRTSARP